MGVFSENAIIGASAAGGYDIDQSLRFNRGDSAYLIRTPSSAGNRKTWTWSGWIKPADFGTYRVIVSVLNTDANFRFLDDDRLDCVDGGGGHRLITSMKFRDPSAWYHILYVMDTTQSTASNRLKLYVNGSQLTAFDTATYPTQDKQFDMNNNVAQGMSFSSDSFGGYLAEVHLIDGTSPYTIILW